MTHALRHTEAYVAVCRAKEIEGSTLNSLARMNKRQGRGREKKTRRQKGREGGVDRNEQDDGERLLLVGGIYIYRLGPGATKVRRFARVEGRGKTATHTQKGARLQKRRPGLAVRTAKVLFSIALKSNKKLSLGSLGILHCCCCSRQACEQHTHLDNLKVFVIISPL